MRLKHFALWSGFGLVAACSFFPLQAEETQLFEPPAVYLQWQRDPTTTMTVHWHTTNRAKTTLHFRAVEETAWQTANGTSVLMPEQKADRTIHTVELTGLRPKTDYLIRFGEKSREFKFRTMPVDLSEPIRFVEGGDMFHKREWLDQMNTLMGKYDPAFAVVGGDLAYANNRTNAVEDIKRWYDYFESWKKTAITPDGRLIPLLVTLGNHEVKGFWGQGNEKAACFYACFSLPGKQGYNVLDFGNYLSLLLLDSGLTHAVKGVQTDWIAETLQQRRQVPHVFPVYHVPAYPSVREDEEGGENGQITEDIREYWVPLFEKNGVKIAFEHHDHAFKRTMPLLAGKVNPQGITYLGDGAWAVAPRKTEPKGHRWYIARAEAVRHFYLVTLYRDQRDVLAVNDKGEVFDQVYQRVKKSR